MPNICVSFSCAEQIEPFLRAHPEADLIEVRMDLMSLSDADIAQIFSLPATAIAICRPNSRMNDEERFSSLKKALSAGASCVDVELETVFIDEILEIARRNGKKTIVSYHHFEETPPYETLRGIASNIKRYRPDIIKIACFVQDAADVANLRKLYDDFDSIIAIGMGEKGVETRIRACDWGAPFSYAAAEKDASTAPGQFDYETMTNIMS